MTKIAPHNTEAEEAVIGSLLIDPDCLKVVSFLKPSDFFGEACRSIYGACIQLDERHEAINQITIAQELNRAEQLTKVGGAAYLSHLISIVPTSLDAEHYAEIVHRLSVSRNLISVAGQIADLGYQEEPDIDNSIKQAESLLQAVKSEAGIRKLEIVTPEEMANTMDDMLQRGESCLSWGFRDLDTETTGIYQQDYIVIAGRPGMAKSETMLQVAENIGRCKKKVLFASTEMGRNPVLERYIARQLKMSVREYRNRQITLEQEAMFMDAQGRLAELPVYYLFGNRTSDSIWQQARKMKESIGLDIIFIDYLQLLDDCYSGRDNHSVSVGKVSKNMKAISHDLNVPVVVASQLNRLVEYRENKRPMLSDLRESGAIEQDADVVLMLHRPDQYRPDKNEPDPPKGTLEIFMAKHRQLGAGTKPVKLQWVDNEHRYRDATKLEGV